MTKQGRHLYEFGRFQVDPEEHLLLREGRPVHVTTKAFETLPGADPNVVTVRRGEGCERDFDDELFGCQYAQGLR